MYYLFTRYSIEAFHPINLIKILLKSNISGQNQSFFITIGYIQTKSSSIAKTKEKNMSLE